MKIFITGTSTDVGKTISSAIITESLEADYWKPIQSGDLDNSDSMKVGRLISNPKSVIHKSSYEFKTPASPHLSAALENQTIELSKIVEPETTNHLVIEGAGGLLVPLNDHDVIADLIRHDYKVIIVATNYLGSINHTLLTIEGLKARNVEVAGIVFSGESNKSSEEMILNRSGVRCIGRIEKEPYFDQNVILEYADKFRSELLALNEPNA